MKSITSITQFLLFLICTFSSLEATNYPPIYHLNGSIAWTGDEFSSFYHDNYSLAWNGFKDPKSPFSFKDGQKVWDGLLYHECGYFSDSSVYHLNGVKAWGGASVDDSYFPYKLSAIFHDNGQKAWGGFLHKDCFYPYSNCIVYHSNGNIAWHGAKPSELIYSYLRATFYHTNGMPAWKGAFAQEGVGIEACGLYYDNGQLAWSGRTTDPIYDMHGNITTGRAESINLALGDDSFLQVHSNGTMFFFLSLGNEGFLRFSNKDDNPELWITIGPGYRLIFSPRTANPAKLQVYDKFFVIQ